MLTHAGRTLGSMLILILAQPPLLSAAQPAQPSALPAGSLRANPQTQPATGPTTLPTAEARGSKPVTFPTEDNLLITGTYWPPPIKPDRAPMAILLHMYSSDRSAYQPLVPHLHAAGLAVLAIDFRGHGQSVGPPELGLAKRVAKRDKKLFAAMDKDVSAAYAWLAKQPRVDPSRFVLVGASVGCSVAIKYAARDRSVDGVVCLTPGTAYMGIDSIADARKYGKRPLLLIASQNERSASDELGHLAAGATVQIVPAKGGDNAMALHGTRMFGQVPHIEETITAFLVKAAGPPTRSPVLASIDGEVYHSAEGGGTGQINKDNIRWFSSAEEAESRGLRPPKMRTTSRQSNSSKTTTGGEPFPGRDAPKNDNR